MQASTGLEANLTRRIMAALKAMGAPALRQPASYRTGKGRSDLIVPLLCLEIKTKSGVVSPEQDGWLRRQRAEGIPAYVVRSVAAAEAAVTLTRKGYVPMPNESIELDLGFLEGLVSSQGPETPEATPEVEEKLESLSLDDFVKQAQDGDVSLPPAEETLAAADNEADTLLAMLTGETPTPTQDPPLQGTPEPTPGPATMVSAAELTQAASSGGASLRDIADVIGEIGQLHIKLAGVLRSYASGQDGKPAIEPAKRTRTRRASQSEQTS